MVSTDFYGFRLRLVVGAEAAAEAEAESEEESEEEAELGEEAEPEKPPDRVGLNMEIQGCDPDDCDFVCSLCEWELCIVEVDHGRCCDITILGDGSLCKQVSNRFLRMPAAAAKRRRRDE